MPESMLLDLQGKLTRIMRPDDRLMQVTAANRHNVGLAILKKDPTTGNLKVNAHNHHKTDAGVL